MRKLDPLVARAREILLKIRIERDQKLNEYVQNIAQEKNIKNIWDGKEIKKCELDDLVLIRAHSLIIDPPLDFTSIDPKIFLHPRGSVNEWLAAWCEASECESTCRGRKSFSHLLREGRFWNRNDRNSSVIQALSRAFKNGQVLNWINSMDAATKSKDTYESYLVGFIKFVADGFLSAQAFFPYYCPTIFPHEAAQFLYYLEQFALKSTTLKTYANILLARSLIYVSLPIKKLLSLKAPDNIEMRLHCDESFFPVTKSFIELWQCFPKSEYLFPSYFHNLPNPNQALNTKIERLGGRTGLYLKMTPTILQNVLKDLHATAKFVPPSNTVTHPLTSSRREVLCQFSREVRAQTEKIFRILRISLV